MSSNPDYEPVARANETPADSAGESPPPDEVTRLAAELAAAQDQLKDARDAQLRAVAEIDNVRKRAQRDVEAAQPLSRSNASPPTCSTCATAWNSGSPQAARPPTPARSWRAGGDACGSSTGLREGRHRAHRPAGPAVQPGTPRGDGHPADRGPARRAPCWPWSRRAIRLNGRLLRPARVIVARAPDPAP